MVKRLIVSRNAYLSIDRIIEFNNLRNQSDIYSRKFVKNLFREFELLKRQPLMGINTNREGDLLLIWDNYYIYYDITETYVEVKSVRHQKENIQR